METYTELKEFVENPHYQLQRQQSLGSLTNDMLDPPIVDIITGFNKLTCCFTLQCCYGHFVFSGQSDPHNLAPLPVKKSPARVAYRIAYIGFCLENTVPGKKLFEALKEITVVDPENIQFCCAEWFWEHQVNSYALQVEPERLKHMDKTILDYREALHIEKVRNEFFIRLEELLRGMKI